MSAEDGQERLSERVRKNLAGVSHQALSLMQHCIMTDDEVAVDLATQINGTVHLVCEELRQNGQELPPIAVDAYDVPFHLLDTPANRRLLSALEEAYRAAEEVDHERGQDEEDGVMAQWVGEILYTVRREVHGEPGRGLE